MALITVQRKILDQTVSFHYQPKAQHALFLSGGLDSLSLLNWFSLEAPDLMENLVLFTIEKEPTLSAKKIAAHYNIKNHCFFPANPVQGVAAANAVQKHPEIKFFFAALTENPKVRLTFEGEEAARGERPTKRVQLPFVDLDKRYTVQLALDLNAPIQYSHTCTKLELEHCGQCFMCAERRWAFTELKAKDPTIYMER